MQKFAERTKEIIERVPEPRRKELRSEFNGAFVKEFGFQKIQNFTEIKKAKATRMASAIVEIMIDPYF